MANSVFKPMLCPVCGQYEFVDDTELEKAVPDYAGYQGDQCSHCGWIYDLAQTEDPNRKDGNNTLSLNEYIVWYQQKVAEDPKYDYSDSLYEPTPHICPVCKKHRFSDSFSYEICPFCGWIDDGVMEAEPDKWAGNANDLCLNDYKARYEKLIQNNPTYKYNKES